MSIRVREMDVFSEEIACRNMYECPTAVWMFFDHVINHVHERALRIAYKENRHYFVLLWEQTNSVPVHIRSLQLLMTEMLKQNQI